MKRFSRSARAYILAVVASGGLALLISLPRGFETSDLALFATLAVSGILTGIYPLPLVRRHGMINLTGSILLMAVFLTTVPMAAVIAAVVALVCGLAERHRPWNVLFMMGSNVLAVVVGTAIYRGTANLTLLPLDDWENALALLFSAGGYWLSITGFVTAIAAARSGRSLPRTFLDNFRELFLQCILLTLLAVLGAAAWRQGAVYAFLLLVPAVTAHQLLSLTVVKEKQVIHAIEIIAEVLDRRNPFTFQHSLRVADYATRVARQLGLGENEIDTVRGAALIHDIGKLGVEDPMEEMAPGKWDVTDYQFYNLKQHAYLGAMIAREIPAFEEAEELIRYHHDWFDGSRVSRPHSSECIPLGARIIAVADSYDRLCMANGEASVGYDSMAIEQLRGMSGRQLDPQLLATFLALLETEAGAAPSRLGLQATALRSAED